MNGTNYDNWDLEYLSIEDCAKKYGVSKGAIVKARNRRGIFSKKVKVLITTPYERKVVGSIQDCASVLELSRVSIAKALKGERVATLEELEIKVEVYENGKK